MMNPAPACTPPNGLSTGVQCMRDLVLASGSGADCAFVQVLVASDESQDDEAGARTVYKIVGSYSLDV